MPESPAGGSAVPSTETAAGETPVVTTYAIDRRISRFTLRVFAGGMLSAFGHNPTIAVRDFSGEARFGSETLEDAALNFRVNAASLEVSDDVSDKDRRDIERQMHQDVLEVSRYPEISYRSARASGNRLGPGQFMIALNGDLTLHGVTRTQTIPIRLSVSPETLRASGEFSLRQSDYGIKLVTAVGGTIKVKDEMKCSFDMVARRQG